MIITFEDFERKIMEMMLSGNDSNLEIMRIQYSNSRVKNREFTGAGFFTNFQTDLNLPKVMGKQKFHFGDLKVDLKDVELGVGFVLFIVDGYISYLEGYTYDTSWPEKLDVLSWGFESGSERDLNKLREVWN